MNPRFPVYIISKGRADSRLTSRALEQARIPYHIVIEEAEYGDYAAVIDPAKILVLDMSYKDAYDLCDGLGMDKSTGSGPARNFVWDHSIKRGYEWHWIVDDNIRGWHRLNRNRKIPLGDGAMWRACEDFVLRYENVAMAGPNYDFFTPRLEKKSPFTPNTRIYSHLLIRNDIPFRWRGRYNEDTILSLDVLKAGWCTILFNAFLQKKVPTQALKGGNTDAFYAREGTLPKSQMLVREHPDVARLIKRWGRWHHYVDYRPFTRNRLRRKLGLEIPDGVNEYEMQLVVKDAVHV